MTNTANDMISNRQGVISRLERRYKVTGEFQRVHFGLQQRDRVSME